MEYAGIIKSYTRYCSLIRSASTVKTVTCFQSYRRISNQQLESRKVSARCHPTTFCCTYILTYPHTPSTVCTHSILSLDHLHQVTAVSPQQPGVVQQASCMLAAGWFLYCSAIQWSQSYHDIHVLQRLKITRDGSHYKIITTPSKVRYFTYCTFN